MSSMSNGPDVDLIFFDAGGGHRAAACALKQVLEARVPHWNVRMVNLREVLEPIDYIGRITGVRPEDYYNWLLKRGFTRGTGPMLRATQMLIRMFHAESVELLSGFWQPKRRDLVVSLIPNFNRAILQGLRTADSLSSRLATPMVTILTDLADYPPHFWIEQQDQSFICGTDKAVRQALALGHPPEQIYRVSGMIVRPEFYRALDPPRDRELVRFGLDPAMPAGLVMFGGFGSREMARIAQRVARAQVHTQLIFLCGHNDALKEELLAMRLPFPHRMLSFTTEVPTLMRVCDYFIGKPGPGSISEALVAGLPVIVERNAKTMVQERYNTEWIEQEGVGVVLRSFSEVADGITTVLEPRRAAEFRKRIASLQNRAVFEIPQILESLMRRELDRLPSASADYRCGTELRTDGCGASVS